MSARNCRSSIVVSYTTARHSEPVWSRVIVAPRPAHQGLGEEAIANQVRDGQDAEVVLAAKASRSGIRAMVPSSFMISQMTPAGVEIGEPREVDRALGLPGATRTPPLRARSGKT